MTPERAVLADVLASDEIGGLPVPTTGELAERVELALARRGYRVVRIIGENIEDHGGPERRLAIQGYPCTCVAKPWCLEHPFGPPKVHTD